MNKINRKLILSLLLIAALFSFSCQTVSNLVGGEDQGQEEKRTSDEEEDAPVAGDEPDEDLPDVEVEEPEEEPVEPEVEDAANCDSDCLELAYQGAFDGSVVKITGRLYPYDIEIFLETVSEFESQTGISIEYISYESDFHNFMTTMLAAGDTPDIVDYSYDDLVQFAQYGGIVDLRDFMDLNQLEQNYDQSWLQMASVDTADGEIMAGVWHRYQGKSYVWYPKPAFDEAGYMLPADFQEFYALMEIMATTNIQPWCIGLESGAATGWPGTDWIEDIVVRTAGADFYDQWVSHDLKFDSPEIRRAFQILGDIWFYDDYVYGGRDSIAFSYFGDAPAPMFNNPPGCWFHKQGAFISTFFPENVVYGQDYDVFLLPPIDAEYGTPMVIFGNIMSMYNDRPEVRAVMEFFATGESMKAWVQAGGVLSPHNDTQLDWYPEGLDRKLAELSESISFFRFDGSDLMPGEVGAGSFWMIITEYASGGMELDEALQALDASWP